MGGCLCSTDLDQHMEMDMDMEMEMEELRVLDSKVTITTCSAAQCNHHLFSSMDHK
jgi:hypothetical protein